MSDRTSAALDQLERLAIEADARSAEIEAARSLPRDLVEGLIGTGAFRLAVPPSLGGVGADLGTVLAAVERTAAHDGSTGWLVMTAAASSVEAGRLPPHHAEVVFGDPRAVVTTVPTPGGRGRLTEDGGLVVSGRWPLAAGAAHSTWLGGGVGLVDEDDRPVAGPQGQHEVVAYFRRDQVVVLDTWHSLGLRGSGATDYETTQAFVPEGRWVATDPGPVAGRLPSRASGGEVQGLGVAAVALGLAARAVDEVAGVVATGADGRPSPLGPRPAVRAELARLGADLEGGRDHLAAVVDRVDSARPAEEADDLRARVTATASAVHLVDRAVELVARCYRLGGPGAVYHASRLQRLLRDVHTAAQHPSVAPERLEELDRPGDGPAD